MFCWYFREKIPCEILGICKLVCFNKNVSDEGSIHFCDQAIYATSIVVKYLDTSKGKASTKFYETILPSDMIFTKDNTSTSD